MERARDGRDAPAAVEISRSIDASADTVWAILTRPAEFSAWMEGDVAFAAEVGASFRAEFPQVGTVVAGEIVSLDPDRRRLSLTWGIERGARSRAFPAGSSLVELSLRARGTRCRLELRHAGLPSAEAAEEQKNGWRFQLSRLDVMANRADLLRGLERALRHWLAAWNESDAEARERALERCCADDVAFRDDWTDLVGIRDLSAHIGNCHRYMPNYRLERAGDVRVCRGEALVDWRASGPGAATTGTNHVVADPDGTIRRVTGFSTPESPET